MRRSGLLLLSLIAACSSIAPTAASDSFVERHLATIPDNADPQWTVAFSSDGRYAAYVAKTHDGCWVTRGDWSSRRFEALC